MPKRLDDVAPPVTGEQWRVQYGTSEAAAEWPELCSRFPGVTGEAWERMRNRPLERTGTQKPLAGSLSTREVAGVELPQWQIDITPGGRVLYCVDTKRHKAWLMMASAGHPGATVARGKRSSRNR